ncbi:MAG: hypothetical protein HYV66_02860 [Candidatus Sungbacteria bacterium]|uniref:Yeast cell wall synthesis Kre9/Knh1-like N-terminal domain-containing protein n=1 Tax=Candidatus Sungiibacteriota bacterium TaxID=2750080 RepID=A0A932DSL0_9BACT|nr:hypothetical protein [Candidatus Sungbacteria bacterium]
MRAFLKCAVLVAFAMFFIACGDNPNGPDYDVQPAAKMATDVGVTTAVAFTGDTDAGELRITAEGYFHGGIIANSAMTACTKTSGTPLTISAMVGTSEKVVQRGLSPVGDGSSVWWGYIQGYPKNTTSESRNVTFIVSATDTNGVVVGADTITLVQPVYDVPSPQPMPLSLFMEASYVSYMEVTKTETVTKTEEITNTGGSAGPGSIGTTTVISGSGHGGSSSNTQTPTQSVAELITVSSTSSVETGNDSIESMALESDNKQSSIVVLSPNGGESWSLGSTQTIKWSSRNVKKVSFWLCRGNTCGRIGVGKLPATGIANIGSYTFVVGTDVTPFGAYVPSSSLIPSSNLKIRVASEDDYPISSVDDKSDEPFSVEYEKVPQVLQLGWEVRLCREGIPCTDSFWRVFGQHPLATDGVDEVQAIYFQEGMPADIVYPPLPPGENRLFLLMLGNQYLTRDIRSVGSSEVVFRFYIQHAPDPSATLTWDLSRFPKTATGEVVNTYTGSHLADIQDGEVTIYPPLDKIDFVVRHKQN